MEFTITEHTSPCSYIRQYPHGAKNDDAVLQLAVKEYRPKNDHAPDEDAVTIIAAHGIGFPKEAYLPLWEELVKAADGFKIASIWIADVANHGASYDLNKEELGDDPNWTDHSLDLLMMINRFRHRMKPPFIGIAHSMGCAQLLHLAHLHPRLFQSLALMEPVLQTFHPPGPNSALFSSLRRDRWDSRTKAESQISKNGFFASMDPRALKLFLAYGLRDTPGGGVTLSTPKAQEAWTYVRPNFQPMSDDTPEGRKRERLLNPDVFPFSEESRALTMRGEFLPLCESLPQLRPTALYIYGEYTHINLDEVRDMHLTQTGSGRGGNGGASDGGVASEMLEDCGHLCPFEKPDVIAGLISKWLKPEIDRWREENSFWSTVDTGKSKNDRKDMSDRWLATVKQDTTSQRPGATKARL